MRILELEVLVPKYFSNIEFPLTDPRPNDQMFVVPSRKRSPIPNPSDRPIVISAERHLRH